MAQNFLGAYTGTILDGFTLVSTYWRVYFDDESEGFTVDYYFGEEDYTIGNTPNDYSHLTPANINGVELNTYSAFQYCASGNLIRFRERSTYPFYVKEILANHFSCVQVVCDLAFNMNPKISPTNVEVSASSSYLPIEYSLIEDFIYGTGSPFGVFDLNPGIYTIYAQDGVGCKASIVVTIPQASGYALKYFSEYDDRNGDTTRIEIYEKKYLGTSSEVMASGDPLNITTGQRDQLRTEPIKASKANISFNSMTDRQFEDLFTSDSRQYRIDIKKEGVLFWSGWLVPDFWKEPYLQPPYAVDFEATDGLGDLRKVPFITEGQWEEYNFSGRMTHMEVIVICLNKLGLNLPIWTSVNVFEENQPYLPTKGVLFQQIEIDSNSTIPTTLNATTQYSFHVVANAPITLEYEGVDIPLVNTIGLVNSDFFYGLTGWQSAVYGNSAPWEWVPGGKARTYKTVWEGNSNSELLYQSYLFQAGVEYTINLDVDRSSTSAGTSKLIVYIGDLNNKEEVFASSLTNTDNSYSFSFTPSAPKQNIFFYVEYGGSADATSFTMDNVFLTSDSKVYDVSYIPLISNGELSITFTGATADVLIDIFEAVKDPISQIYVDTANYYSEEGTPMNCYEVISEQLKPYGARIFQAEGAWHIIKFDQANGEYLRNKYTYEGVYEYSEYYNPIQDVLYPTESVDDIWVHKRQLLEVKPGYRYQIIDQSLGYIENLIPGGDFSYDSFNFSNLGGVGVLKDFVYGSTFSNNPIFYSYKDIDQDGNGGVDFGNNYATLRHMYARAYFGFGGAIPQGLPPSTATATLLALNLKNGDYVLMYHATDPFKNNLYRVVEDGEWVPLLKSSDDGSYIIIDDVFYQVVNIPVGGIDDTDYLIFVQTSVTQISDLAIVNPGLSWIKSNQISLEYQTRDKLLIKLKKLFTKGNEVNYFGGGDEFFIGLQVKLGNKYANQKRVFTNSFAFIEIPMSASNNGKFTEDIIELSLPLTTDNSVLEEQLSVMIWYYTKPNRPPQVSYEGGGDGGWGTVTLDFVGENSTLTSLVLDHLKVIYLPGGELPDVTRSIKLNNSPRFAFVPDNVEVMHADLPDYLNAEKLYNQHLTLPNGSPTQFWRRKNYYESKNLLKLLLESILANNLKSNELISGVYRNKLSLINTIYDPTNPDKLFMIGSVTYNDKYLESDIELMELSLNEDMSNNTDAAFTVGFSIGFKS